MQIIAFVLTSLLSRFRSERGQDLIEYALLSGLIAAAIIAALLSTTIFSDAVSNMVNTISECIDFDAATACDSPFI